MKALYLTLEKEAFETMFQELKKNEYRFNNPNTNWIKSRLIDKKTGKKKNYDVVVFKNGYGSKPYFICSYLGFKIAKKNYTVKYENGFKVDVTRGMYNIKIGAMLRFGNVFSNELF